MRVGSKSLLFGVHQFVLHSVAVLVAWVRLYGWPRWWELIAILVHDIGYWDCETMDGPDGAEHPRKGAEIAGIVVYLFSGDTVLPHMAYELCVGHSRTYARNHRTGISKLCKADKLGSTVLPRWLYLSLARASGELAEYRQNAADYHVRTGKGIPLEASDSEWHAWMCEYMHQACNNDT